MVPPQVWVTNAQGDTGSEAQGPSPKMLPQSSARQSWQTTLLGESFDAC